MDGGLREYGLEAMHGLEVRGGRRGVEDASEAYPRPARALDVHLVGVRTGVRARARAGVRIRGRVGLGSGWGWG